MSSPGPSRRLPRDAGLIWTILISALVHAFALALLLVTPQRFLGAPLPVESYTVELVAPAAIGGVNTAPRREEAAPGADERRSPGEMAAAEVPAAIVAEPAAAKPASAAERQPPTGDLGVPQPAEGGERKPEVEQVAKQEVEQAVEQAAEQEVEQVAKLEVGQTAEPALERSAAPEVAKPAKPSPPAAAGGPARGESQGAASDQDAKRREPPPAGSAAENAQRAARQRDERIARAVERRAELVEDEARDLDRRIFAAVRRRAAVVSGTAADAGGSAAADGPLSYGPESGAGGVVRGMQYLLYRSRMEARIKAAWAWAGNDPSLQAMIRFDIRPDGKIVDVRTLESSGDASYDASVQRAVRAANPLGPVPEMYLREFSTVELTFRAQDLRP